MSRTSSGKETCKFSVRLTASTYAIIQALKVGNDRPEDVIRSNALFAIKVRHISLNGLSNLLPPDFYKDGGKDGKSKRHNNIASDKDKGLSPKE